MSSDPINHRLGRTEPEATSAKLVAVTDGANAERLLTSDPDAYRAGAKHVGDPVSVQAGGGSENHAYRHLADVDVMPADSASALRTLLHRAIR